MIYAPSFRPEAFVTVPGSILAGGRPNLDQNQNIESQGSQMEPEIIQAGPIGLETRPTRWGGFAPHLFGRVWKPIELVPQNHVVRLRPGPWLQMPSTLVSAPVAYQVTCILVFGLRFELKAVSHDLDIGLVGQISSMYAPSFKSEALVTVPGIFGAR
jgi:hypothetical protein